MNKKINNLIRILIFSIVGLLLFLNLYRILSWKDTAANYDSTLNTFYKLDKNKVDVLFLGSSHCYCAINVGQLWEEHGISAYSLSMSGQDLISSYYCIEEALKTQHPKVVCLELMYALWHGYEDDGNLYRNTLGYRPSVTAYKVARDIAEEREDRELFRNLLARFPIIHTRYRELEKEDFIQVGPDYMGFHCNYTINNDWSIRGTDYHYNPDETPAPIEPTQEAWLNKIMTLCHENDIELCLFVSPYIAVDEDQNHFRYIENLAAENNVAFLDFIRLGNEINIDSDTDFIDWGHVNYYGSEKVCSYMGSFLCSQYQLADHRGQKGYEPWDNNARAMNHEKAIHSLKTESNLTAYLNKLKKLDNCAILVSTAGIFRNDSNAITASMKNFGIPTEQFNAGGTWLIEDSKTEYVPHAGIYNKHWYFDQTTLSVMGGLGNDFVYVNRNNTVLKDNGIVIIVYDKFLQDTVEIAEISTDDNFVIMH